MMYDIISAIYEGCKIELSFENGRSRVVDFTQYIKRGGVFCKLSEVEGASCLRKAFIEASGGKNLGKTISAEASKGKESGCQDRFESTLTERYPKGLGFPDKTFDRVNHILIWVHDSL